MFNSFISQYFGFNRQQRNGLLVLCAISVSLLLVRISYPSFMRPDNIEVKTLALVELKLDSIESFRPHFNVGTNEKEERFKNLFVFDPNKVTHKQLLQLGFKEKGAKTFLKFRDKGFVFESKSDLKRVYGITDEIYETLEPYIVIESRKLHKEKTKNPVVEHKKTETKAVQKQALLELNSTDSLALVQLRGIGPSFAKRILKYRSMLGGYVSVDQLKEVYGFTEELFDLVKNNVTVNPAAIKKINLNKDDFKGINKHPYLSYEFTKTLFDFRRKNKINADNLKDLINDAALYQRLLPYLTFE